MVVLPVIPQHTQIAAKSIESHRVIIPITRIFIPAAFSTNRT